jgi:hypothetical protein
MPVPPQPVPRFERPRPRTILLAGLVFALGAVAGGYIGERHQASPLATLEVRAAPPTSSIVVAKKRQHSPERQSSARQAQSQALGLSEPSRRGRPTSAAPQTGRHIRRVTWAPNVLGVSVRVGLPGVTLVWQKPINSGHVVVLRALGVHKRGVVVYRGRAASYHDISPRPCTAYRYTIVNFDPRGHRSTGVPTSVVTSGCA